MVAHLRTRAAGLGQHSRDNPIGCPLQQVPDERAPDAEAHHHELVDAQVIHQPELIVRISVPWVVDLERTRGLAATSVAQIGRDAVVLSLEIFDRIKGRVAGEVGDRRIQSAAGDEQQREARTDLLKVDANGASFVEGHCNFSLPSLLSKYRGAVAIAVAAAPAVSMLRLFESIISPP